MIEPPEITKTVARSAAVIPFTIPREEMGRVMGPGIGELMATLATQGITPAGPLFSHHFRMDPATFDFEIGIPVDEPVSPSGRVQVGELPATSVARTVYHGSYEGLGPAWREFDAWIKAQGLQARAERWESYVLGPQPGADSTAFRTELVRPLIDPK